MGYRDRVLRDLAAWREAGWVSEDGAAAIAASLPHRRAFGFAAIVGMLGAILVGAGLLAFIAANWELVPRAVKFGGALVIMALAYAAAWPLRRREHPGFAEAAMVVGALAFAGLLALIGQTYNLGDDFAGLIAVWTGGVLAAAALVASPAVVILGLAGGVAWSLAATSVAESPHWLGILPVLAGGALAMALPSLPARAIAVLAFLAWCLIALVAAAAAGDWNRAEATGVAAMIALAVLAAALALGATASPRLASLGGAALWPGLAAVLLALGVFQLADKPAEFSGAFLAWLAAATVAALACTALALVTATRHRPGVLPAFGFVAAVLAFMAFVPADELVAGLFGGAIVLAATVWAVHLGRADLVPTATATGLAAFGFEVIYIYVATLGTVLDTSLVFVSGGVLFIVLAAALYRVERWLSRRQGEAAS